MTVQDGERRNIMENNENKKAPEALADEALDQVAGGWNRETLDQNMFACSECIKWFTVDKLNWHDGHYYCPDCGTQVW